MPVHIGRGTGHILWSFVSEHRFRDFGKVEHNIGDHLRGVEHVPGPAVECVEIGTGCQVLEDAVFRLHVAVSMDVGVQYLHQQLQLLGTAVGRRQV